MVAAVFGGMAFGQTTLASRVVYTLVGLSAGYLLGRTSALVGSWQRLPATR